MNYLKINKMGIVKVYGVDGCPYCTELKELLNKEKIEFTDVDVNLPENQTEYNQIYKITNSDDVPIVRVNKRLLVPNVSYQTIQDAVDLTKKFLAED